MGGLGAAPGDPAAAADHRVRGRGRRRGRGEPLAGANAAELAQAGWGVALQLWFLPVYLLLIALTPALHAAHRRWGLRGAGGDAPRRGGRRRQACSAPASGLGYANYLLVWGSMHQWGFAWQDGTLTRRRWRPYGLAVAGAALLGGLLAWSPFPVNMVGTTGGGVNNTVPPSVALLAFAAVQTGLLLAAEPAVSRLLARLPQLREQISWLNDRVLTVYLWHMTPVVVVAVALYPTGLLPQPAIGSAGWWALRPAWIAALALVLAPAAIWLARFERPLRRRPDTQPLRGQAAQRLSGQAAQPLRGEAAPPARGPAALRAALVAVGVGAAGVALARIAILGFAPGGDVPAGTLAAYGCGVILTLAAGRLAPRMTVAERPV